MTAQLGPGYHPSLGGATVAPAGDLYLKMVISDRTRRTVRCGYLDARIGQTLDLATVNTGKMRMLFGLAMRLVTQFKTPDVIAVVRSRQEAGVSQVNKIPVERRPVQSRRLQGFGDLRMAHRSDCLLKPLQHSNSGTCAPQPGGSNQGAEFYD